MAADSGAPPGLQHVKESKDYNFPEEEEKILQLWQELDAFREQLRRTEGKPEFSFYDGPPFATGMPHYGHLLAGTLKVGACGGRRPHAMRAAAAGGNRRGAAQGCTLLPRAWLRARRGPTRLCRAALPAAGHCDAVRQRHRAPRHAPLWLGLPRPACGV